MKHLTRPLIYLLALVVLVETWIWERIGPLIRRFVEALPFEALKQAIRVGLEKLPPYPTLAVFVVPILLLIPFKLAGLSLIAHGHVFLGTGVFILAKFAGVGMEAFLFETCKPKLMQIPLFARLYDRWHVWLAWAHTLIDPVKARILEATSRIRRLVSPGQAPRAFRFLRQFRRMQRARVRPA